MMIFLLALALGAGAVQNEDLSAAFERARRPASERASAPRGGSSTSGFVPAGCMVESWCLVNATSCFVGRVARPTGLWQAHAQYSVVRKVAALCPDRYGALQKVTLTGPVEPVTFSSELETAEETASREALRLCRTYRQDWVAAAPSCERRCE